MATQRSFSVAQANSGLSRVIRQAEQDGEVALTRHGHPIAILLSVERYRDLVRNPPKSLLERLKDLREKYALEAIDFDSDEFLAGLRATDRGRDFSW